MRSNVAAPPVEMTTKPIKRKIKRYARNCDNQNTGKNLVRLKC